LYQHLDGKIENPQEVIAAIVERNPRQIQHMRRRGEAFQFPFGQWADREQSREDPSAIIAAVDALADETNNLSRQLLSRNVASVYESNDEQVLADMLRAWAKSEDISPYVAQQQSPAGTADKETPNDGSVDAEHDESHSEPLNAEYNGQDGGTPRWDPQVLDETETKSGDSDLSDFDAKEAASERNDGANDG
jgi:hypothetical protein